MKTPKHDNSGNCPRCQLIFETYPGFYPPLRAWFENFQKKHPEGHISCAGRGYDAQQALFYAKVTRDVYPASSHNWNCAIDLFCQLPQNGDIYDRTWFYQVLAPEIPAYFTWYGRANARFPELPHLELGGWEAAASRKEIQTVEELT
jgi:hypothetical protein